MPDLDVRGELRELQAFFRTASERCPHLRGEFLLDNDGRILLFGIGRPPDHFDGQIMICGVPEDETPVVMDLNLACERAGLLLPHCVSVFPDNAHMRDLLVAPGDAVHRWIAFLCSRTKNALSTHVTDDEGNRITRAWFDGFADLCANVVGLLLNRWFRYAIPDRGPMTLSDLHESIADAADTSPKGQGDQSGVINGTPSPPTEGSCPETTAPVYSGVGACTLPSKEQIIQQVYHACMDEWWGPVLLQEEWTRWLVGWCFELPPSEVRAMSVPKLLPYLALIRKGEWKRPPKSRPGQENDTANVILPPTVTPQQGKTPDGNKSTVQLEVALGERAQLALKVLLDKEAFASDHRQRTEDIVVAAIGKSADANQFKEVIAGLKRLGYVDTKEGRGGGCWLTTSGRMRAEKL
jgi:hypothetical protein